jgi:DNA-binding CsgD family transcriptional regulator
MMLIGRDPECAGLKRLLDGARSGRSGVLVLRGVAGVGKTALLQYAVESAAGFRVAEAVGIESEMELPFATLHQLCGPMLDRIEQLPEPQRDALGTAFGLSVGSAPEAFLVGLAVLSLLAATAEEQPLLCVIDDAQWLDRASAQLLAFVARRLLADPVALVFATREREEAFAGLPELMVEGLDTDHARALLAATVKGRLDKRVRDRIISETHGNPLALVELPKTSSPAALAFGLGMSQALPLTGRIEAGFRRRVEELPPETRRLMLVAAADGLGEPVTVWRAAQSLGISSAAAAPAADAALLDIDMRVRFRHPLVRSAVYAAASTEERRAVHQALADATDPELDPDRRVWHLAAATIGLDPDVAAELERSAGRAQVRGGPAAAAAFLERSAQLTSDPQLRAARLLQAAGAHLTAGANHRAHQLLEPAARDLVHPMARAQAMRMDGVIRFFDGRGGDTPSLLFDAAMALRDLDLELARETLMEAFEAAYWAGKLTKGTTTLDVAEAARAMPVPVPDESPASLLLTGYSERLTTGYEAALEPWRRAAEANAGALRREPHVQWQGMFWNMTGDRFDFAGHVAVARQRVRIGRELGALSDLPIALSCLGWNELQCGRLDIAEALVTEAIEIAAATGNPSMPGAQELMSVATLAWRGREEEARSYAKTGVAEAVVRGQALAVTICQSQLTTLELSLGRYDAARTSALRVFEDDPLFIANFTLPDAVEAMVRSDDLEGARRALVRLSERALPSGTPMALGMWARASALMADDGHAEELYVEATEQLQRAGVFTDLARSHLLYGEWLRRQHRRRDAREQLRIAHDMFQTMGAGLFAQRARVELLATGEHVRTRDPSRADELTSQEQQVAELAAAGESNADIAAQLFISPHTVAYHLRKVYNKLGVKSRNRLRDVLEGQPAAELTSR